MKWIVIAAVLFLSSETVIAQNLGQPSLRGTVTDPSGAAIRGAEVHSAGPDPNNIKQRTKSASTPFLPFAPVSIRSVSRQQGFRLRNEMTSPSTGPLSSTYGLRFSP